MHIMKRVENFSSFFPRKITLFAILSVLLASVACERDNTREIRPPAAETVWITGVQLPVDEVVAAVGETFEVRGQGFGDRMFFNWSSKAAVRRKPISCRWRPLLTKPW